MLRELEAQGVISRRQYLEIPPRVEYSLTENGREPISALKALARWGKKMRNSNQG
ncbi:MAG: winged helix-turn-helix transcriptional regulator [bacterium]